MSSDFDELESAVIENLSARGVLSRLRAALDAEIISSLREAPLGAPPPAPPDVHLADALVSEYLFSRGLHSTLSIFCTEAAVPLPAGARAPGSSLGPRGKAGEGADGRAGAGAHADIGSSSSAAGASIDAIARAITERVAEPLLAGSLGQIRSVASEKASAPSSNERARATVRDWLQSTAGVRADTPPGSLGRDVVAGQLGIEGLIAELGLAAERDGTPVLPLLLALVVDARTRTEEGSLAVPGWLAPGAREGLAAAAAAIGTAARDARRAAVAAASASSRPIALRPIAASPSEPAFDSDEDVPGVLARVGAAAARSEHATAAARDAAARQLVAGSHDARFASSAAGQTLFLHGDKN